MIRIVKTAGIFRTKEVELPRQDDRMRVREYQRRRQVSQEDVDILDAMDRFFRSGFRVH